MRFAPRAGVRRSVVLGHVTCPSFRASGVPASPPSSPRPEPPMSARSRPLRPVDSHPALPAPGSPELSLLETLARARSRDELVARVASAAVSAEGPGCAQAHVLRWDETTGLFERVGGASASGDAAEASSTPGAADPGWPDGAPPRGAWDLEGLDPLCREAWADGAPRLGRVPGESVPWSRAGSVG